ncbi:hypothetical protein [Actinomadura meridiana]|uniref:hypothetical protein n=1 Tax=Actinomadura meridiana TaxID=559626 RepID=UPI0031F1767B
MTKKPGTHGKSPKPVCKRGKECLDAHEVKPRAYPDGSAGSGIEAYGPGVEQTVPELAQPDLPPAPKPSPVVLPPLNAPGGPQAAAGESQLTLMSPTGLDEGDNTDWAVVIGVALVAEITLLWCAACFGLWRRRIALDRTTSEDDGRTQG